MQIILTGTPEELSRFSEYMQFEDVRTESVVKDDDEEEEEGVEADFIITAHGCKIYEFEIASELERIRTFQHTPYLSAGALRQMAVNRIEHQRAGIMRPIGD